ncbi:hypothetical protein, partial [Salmonella sp. s51228]|uniref:hypothetical protein n=1 Tax=Salmonella sp. s51228 TaxID=3159652 RepID=UPI0039818ACE
GIIEFKIFFNIIIITSPISTLDLTEATLICDPALWCQDTNTAVSCDKLDYCVKWVWGVYPDNMLEGCTPGKSAPNCRDDDDEIIASSGTIECQLCQLFVDYVKAHNATSKEELEKACEELDLSKPICEYIINKVIGFLNNDTSLQICTKARLCTATDTHSDLTSYTDNDEAIINNNNNNNEVIINGDADIDDDDANRASDDDDIEKYFKLYNARKFSDTNKLGAATNVCADCIKIFTEVRNHSGAVELVLELICKILLKGDKLCIAAIEIIKKEIGTISAERACDLLHACTKSSTPDILGPMDNICEEGPGFWCDTKENAFKCQATEFCSKNVWRA